MEIDIKQRVRDTPPTMSDVEMHDECDAEIHIHTGFNFSTSFCFFLLLCGLFARTERLFNLSTQNMVGSFMDSNPWPQCLHLQSA